MKKTLLLTLAALALAGSAVAHEVSPYAIQYDDNELFDINTNPTGWNPNGTIPPQPEADYYVDMLSAGNVYFRLEPVTSSGITYYQSYVPIIKGDFKIYAKEYWTERNKSGYEPNNYIYGSLHEPSGFDRETYKQLGHPGGNLQIEGGGIWYGCEMRLYPTGHDGSGTPELYITGGSKDNQAIFLNATGTPASFTSGHVNFDIIPGGIVKPSEQTYTVTMKYTPADGEEKTISQDVKGLKGSFMDISELKADATTPVNLTVSIENAPVCSNPANLDQISGYKNLEATAETSIVTPGHVYLIGNITGVDWNPSKAIEGTLMTEINPSMPDAASIYAWASVPFTGDMRFRFTNLIANDWTTLEANGSQYYPTGQTGETTVKCNNYFDNNAQEDSKWYSYDTGTTTNSAWAPSETQARGTDGTGYFYNVFFNSKTKKVAVGWSTMVGVTDVDVETEEVPVNVYDMLGRCVMSNVLPSEAVKDLPRGIYIVGDKKVAVR